MENCSRYMRCKVILLCCIVLLFLTYPSVFSAQEYCDNLNGQKLSKCLKRSIKVLDQKLDSVLKKVSDHKCFNEEDINKQVNALKGYRNSFCMFVADRYQSQIHRGNNYDKCYIRLTELWISELK